MMAIAGRAERVVVGFVGVATMLFLLAPPVMVAAASVDPSNFFTFPPTALSGRWYLSFLADGDWNSSLLLTLAIATLSALSAMMIGCPAGVATARCTPRMRRILLGAIIAPLAVPAIVLGISFYGLVLRLHLVGNLATFVVANAVQTAPLVTLLVAGAASSFDTRVEFASLACGASRLRTLLRITLPLIAPSVLVGGALTFLLSLDEVTMTNFLVAPGEVPLAVRLFSAAQTGTAPIVTAAATVLLVGSIVIGLGVIAVFRLLSEYLHGGQASRPWFVGVTVPVVKDAE